MPQLFALLVGVKDYHPDSGVPSLTGCVNDVNGMEAWLQKQFVNGGASIKKLSNEQATRSAFIETFINHFIDNPAIKKDDTVLFYYSGHGSYALSNAAFSEWDTEGRDETMVLYDSRCTGGFDLADKELRLLLSKINKEANIVVIMDSCHSGSGTRAVDDKDVILMGRPKHAPGISKTPRDISAYLSVNGEGYAQLLDGSGKAAFPQVKCLSISACDRYEVAYESGFSPEGMFTSMFLKALDSGEANMSYARLYEHLYTLLKRRANQQTPQMEAQEGFDPDLVVFGSERAKAQATYNVLREKDGKITIDCGALHGLKNDRASMQAVTVSIYNKNTPDTPAKLAKLNAVGLDKSELNINQLPPGVHEAAILNLQPVVCIRIEGTTEQQDKWKELCADQQIENIAFVYTAEQHADYVILFNADSITLHENDKLVHGIKNSDDSSMFYMLSCCKQVSSWHQLLSLKNNAIADVVYRQSFKTTFGIELLDEEGNWVLQPGNDLTLYWSEETGGVPFQLQVTTSADQSWYYALYYLSGHYQVKRLTNAVNESRLAKDKPFAGFGKPLKMGFLYDEEETTDYFKLVISKSPFKEYLIKEFGTLEPEIVEFSDREFATKGLIDDSIDQDWYAQTISVALKRRSGVVNSATSFKQGKLHIQQNNAVSGKASISPVSAASKGIHPSQQLIELTKTAGLDIINLDNSKGVSAAPMQVVWLDEMDGDVSKEPLKITLEEPATDSEEVVALTMEDGVVQIIGIGKQNEHGSYEMEINILPEDQQRKKNLLRAAWFCFAKVVLRKDLSKLRRVEYDEKGKVVYKDEIENCVQPGQRVAVFVHGIIGDTKTIASAMQFLLIEKRYDLLLAFDYENLNSKIENIADTFKKLLSKAGVSSNSPVDIICHSMGGLVSRHLIEQAEGTEGWVNNLYMFGTPNAGSVFGKIPKIRDWSVAVLTVACNAGTTFLGAIGPVLQGINKVLGASVVVTNSLAQMADDSDFYKLLNGKPRNNVTANYYIIAGNVLDFKPADDEGRFSRIMEKIKRQVGEWSYGSTTKNDIAVALTSILSAPTTNVKGTKELACHHLNYFEEDAPMDYFKKLVLTV